MDKLLHRLGEKIKGCIEGFRSSSRIFKTLLPFNS